MFGQSGGNRVLKSVLPIIGVMVLVLGVSSCQKPPQVEKDSANQAIAQAQQSEAAEYAADDLRAAQDSLAAAEQAVNEQNGKFALFRNYKRARALYVAAQASAQTAEQNAARNKVQAQQDAETALAAARQAIADARALLASSDAQALKRGKETRESLKQIDLELGAVDSSLESVVQAQQDEKYMQALNLAQEAQRKASELRNEVQQAIEKRQSIRAMRRS